MRLPYKLVKADLLEKLKTDYRKLLKANEAATAFIKEIESGNLQACFVQGAGSEDELTVALLAMQRQLQNIAREEQERNWSIQGLAMFSDILRTNNLSEKAFYQKLISTLVNYLEGNQGGLFLIQEEPEVSIELVACYAYNRQKYQKKSVLPGEGLLGQCYLEKDTIYLTDIPKDYVNITSGLGAANPACLVIVPLKINEEVHGFVELASFKEIKAYQVQFMEKLGENIAATISMLRVNERTRHLLEESQQQAEEMRAQEEEMRQNMEELSATQEDMQRVLREVQSNEAFITDLLNATDNTIYTIDRDYRIISTNKALKETYEQRLGVKVEKGFDALQFFGREEQELFRTYFKRALDGERFEVTRNEKLNGHEQYITSAFSPLRNELGATIGVAVFGTNVTEVTLAKKVTEELLADTQQKTIQLEAQEEAMRQNMKTLEELQETLASKLQEAQLEMEAQIREIALEKEKNLAILEGCVDGVVSFDEKGIIEFFNHAGEEIWEIPRFEVLGTNIRNLISIEIQYQQGEPQVFYSKNGETQQLDVRTEVPLFGAGGREIEALLSLTRVKVGNAYLFTAFVQKVAVELF